MYSVDLDAKTPALDANRYQLNLYQFVYGSNELFSQINAEIIQFPCF